MPDQNQAEAIVNFMESDLLQAHYAHHNTTILTGIASNALVLAALFDKELSRENPDWLKVRNLFDHIIVACRIKIIDQCITQLLAKHPEIYSN